MSARTTPGSTITPPVVPTRRTQEFNTAKALELRFKGLTYEQIGSVLDSKQPYTAQTVQYHLERFKQFIENPQDLKSYEENRPAVLNALEFELLRSLSDGEAIQKASLRDRTIAFGTVFDKRRLESGQATQNLGILGKIVVDSAKDLFVRPVDRKKSTELSENQNQELSNTAPAAEIVSQ